MSPCPSPIYFQGPRIYSNSNRRALARCIRLLSRPSSDAQAHDSGLAHGARPVAKAHIPKARHSYATGQALTVDDPPTRLRVVMRCPMLSQPRAAQVPVTCLASRGSSDRRHSNRIRATSTFLPNQKKEGKPPSWFPSLRMPSSQGVCLVAPRICHGRCQGMKDVKTTCQFPNNPTYLGKSGPTDLADFSCRKKRVSVVQIMIPLSKPIQEYSLSLCVRSPPPLTLVVGATKLAAPTSHGTINSEVCRPQLGLLQHHG